MSLYLKYRPQNFESVVGQTYVKKTLQSAALQGNMAHAYLFCGPRGTGKTSMARILAKRLNCLNPENNEPCNQCEICQAINQARLVDLIEIDAASNRGIDEIRELREKIVFSPTQAKYKVYIIDEVHMLTKEAFNALLKTLEEPPEHAYFILATTEAHKIPETIVSRCQQFNFSRIELSDIADRLSEITQKESGQADREALELIAKLSHGGLRDAIGLLEQMLLAGPITTQEVSQQLGLTGMDHLERFFNQLIDQKTVDALNLLKEVRAQGKSIPQFTKEFIEYLREQMHQQLSDSKKLSQIVEMIDVFLKAKQQIDLSPIPELPIEMAIIRICGFDQAAAVEPETIEVKHVDLKVKEAPQVAAQAGQEAQSQVQVQQKVEPVSSLPDTLTLESILADWPRVLEHVTTPFVRMSLNDGEPVLYQNQELTIRFKSGTFMENVAHSGHQKMVQDAMETVYGRQIALKLESQKIELSPVQKKEEASPSTEEVSVADMAAEVFGIK